MAIELRPELEELILLDVQRGSYKSVDEFLESAVRLLHSQETWLAEHREDIAERIEAGWAAAVRGEVIGAEEVKERMQRRKDALMKQPFEHE